MPRSLPARLPLLALLASCVALLAPAGASAAIGPLSSFGGFGEGAGQLRGPTGLAIGPDSAIYVADKENNRIAVFSAAGTFLRAFGRDVGGAGVNVCTSFCQAGSSAFPARAEAGSVYQPEDVAVDGSGRVFVSDPELNRIDVFSPAGAFLYAFGKDVDPGGGDRCDPATKCQAGALSSEAGALKDGMGIGVAGSLLFAADNSDNRVNVFNLDGEFQRAFGRNVGGPGVHVCTTVCQEGSGEGSAAIGYPTDVAVGPDGNAYVTYVYGAGVAVFTQQGAYLGRFAGDGPGSLESPVALAIGADGAIHVVDEFHEEVMTYSPAQQFVSSFSVLTSPGIAIDCRGAFYVGDYSGAPSSSKVIRYGEPGTAPCTPPAVPIATVVPANKFKFGKLVLNKNKGTATLTVNVPGPGRLVLKGGGVKKVTKSAKKAGSVKLAVKATGKALKKLNEKGKATLKAKLTFTPTGGTALTKPRSLVLKKKLG